MSRKVDHWKINIHTQDELVEHNSRIFSTKSEMIRQTCAPHTLRKLVEFQCKHSTVWQVCCEPFTRYFPSHTLNVLAFVGSADPRKLNRNCVGKFRQLSEKYWYRTSGQRLQNDLVEFFALIFQSIRPMIWNSENSIEIHNLLVVCPNRKREKPPRMTLEQK